MTDEPLFDREKALACEPRTEWVSTSCGRICVRAMRMSEYFQLSERSQRPKIDPRGGIDTNEAVLWQILLSCYQGEDPNAPPTFSADSPEDIRAIYSLKTQDGLKILGAINRVNGVDASEGELLRDFSAARRGANPLP